MHEAMAAFSEGQEEQMELPVSLDQIQSLLGQMNLGQDMPDQQALVGMLAELGRTVNDGGDLQEEDGDEVLLVDDSGKLYESTETGYKEIKGADYDIFKETEDSLIDDFLEKNKKQTICQFYLKGSCRYGVTCEFYHPV